MLEDILQRQSFEDGGEHFVLSIHTLVQISHLTQEHKFSNVSALVHFLYKPQWRASSLSQSRPVQGLGSGVWGLGSSTSATTAGAGADDVSASRVPLTP